MLNGLLGKKLGMTQVFVEDGNCIPVTVIETASCVVCDKKTQERDGYQAVQLGFGEIRKKRVKKAQAKSFEKNQVPARRVLREFRCEEAGDVQIGQTADAGIFEPGEFLNITGTTKGRGFAGVIKRHGFHGAPGSRGSHEIFRGGGSVGMKAWPGRVLKGKKMPGHYGNTQCTVLNLQVVKVEKEKNLLLVRGATPGPNGGLLILRKTKRAKKG
ncbi:MAG: 50S ribosomal protein L3 [Nitrospinae bacterium]|nr:50S ribosomal protein L3 [Nitrospinota bacterium]